MKLPELAVVRRAVFKAKLTSCASTIPKDQVCRTAGDGLVICLLSLAVESGC